VNAEQGRGAIAGGSSSPSFTVTAAGSRASLDSSGAARVSFTVTNTSAQTLKGRLLTRPSGPAKEEWFSIVGESVRDFAPNASQQAAVELNVPAGTPPGSYNFRLDAVSQVDPDEDYTEGPSVAFEVAAPPPPQKKKFPWWIFAIIGAVVLLIVIGVVVFLLVRGGGSKANVVSSGTGVIHGTFTFDVDTGTEASPASDVFWEQINAVARQMRPLNGATLVNLGRVNFDSLTAKRLSKLKYSSAPIPANADPTNQLVEGDVFAVHSKAGNFAKIKVLSYGYNLGIQWVTFRPRS
jgi:hypothetical protein